MKKIYASISLLIAFCVQAQQPLCFTESTLASVPWNYAIKADYNNDGFDDINGFAMGQAIWMGQGNGTFTLGPSFGPMMMGWNRVATDYNGDGNMDFSMQVPLINRIYIFYGNGNGTFITDSMIVPNLSYYFAKDYNADGKCDMIITYTNQPNQLFLSTSSNSLVASGNCTAAAMNACWGLEDFNGDNYIDILCSNGTGFIIYPGNAACNYTNTIAVSGITPSIGFHVFDVDDDGKCDIVEFSNGIKYWKALNNFTFASPVLSNSGSQFGNSIEFADINSDGKKDIIWPSSLTFSYALFNGANFSSINTYSYSIYSSYNELRIISANINGDGKDDLLIISSDTGPFCTLVVLTNCNRVGVETSYGDVAAISPQPANDYIEVSNLPQSENYLLEVRDLQGRLLEMQYQEIKNGYKIKTSNLANGIYSLCIRINQQAIVKKKIAIAH